MFSLISHFVTMLFCSEFNLLQESSTGLEYYYSLDHHHHHHNHQQPMKSWNLGEPSCDNNNGMIDYLLNNPQQHHQQQQQQLSSSGFSSPSPLEKLNFMDAVQFADFGPRLALNQTKISEDQTGNMDPVYFLKFPVLNDKMEQQQMNPLINQSNIGTVNEKRVVVGEDREPDEEAARVSDNASLQQLRILGDHQDLENKNTIPEVKAKRKRPRTVKTSEEVESQRMTHIAVERNRRKQMNEHLRVLRSLMPGSYVQRGDQASIIGGAIEFVRELEQLLQCLESQKRRRLYGEGAIQQTDHQSPFFPPMQPLTNDQMGFETGLQEETAENKSCLADVEVKVLGFDAMIKILSRRRPGQLIKTIEALEDLQLNILHTNITTIEQTVLYTFNVKVPSESRFTADDIASSVQQIFTFIHANSSICDVI